MHQRQLKFWIMAIAVALGIVALGLLSLHSAQAQMTAMLPTAEQIGLAQFSEGLAATRVHRQLGYLYPTGNEISELQGKWGYFDQTGKQVIPPQFDRAGTFAEGVARVSRDRKVGLIDKTGRVIVPLNYNVDDLPDRFAEGLAPLRQNGKFGYVDRTGKFAIQPSFAGDVQNSPRAFSEGLAAVPMNQKYGFIDKIGKWVIPAQFDEIGYFSEGLVGVRRGKTSGFSDRTGKIIFTLNDFPFARQFSEGWVNIDNKQKKVGYFDRTGRLTIPFKFDYADRFVGDRAVVGIGRTKDGYIKKYGFIDKTGKLMIPAKFDWADSFSEDLAVVGIGSKYGYLNRAGKLVIPAIFDHADQFHDGLAAVQIGTLLADQPSDRRGYINKIGQFILSSKKEPLPTRPDP